MNQYHIHHATGEHRFSEEEVQPRSYAGFVIASSLKDAYCQSQNFTEEGWNPTSPCRSTSVGDIIQSNGDFFMVCNFGFKELISEGNTSDTPLYPPPPTDEELKEINMLVIQHMAQTMLDNPENYGLI